MIGKLLGANWRTSLYGGITLLATAIAFKPDLIAFLPPTPQHYLSGICGIIAFISGGSFVLNAKDKQVTGGTTQQTASGNIADPGTQSLVDETVKASIKSGEQVSPKQRRAIQS